MGTSAHFPARIDLVGASVMMVLSMTGVHLLYKPGLAFSK